MNIPRPLVWVGVGVALLVMFTGVVNRVTQPTKKADNDWEVVPYTAKKASPEPAPVSKVLDPSPSFRIQMQASLTDSWTVIGLSDQVLKRLVTMHNNGQLNGVSAVNFEVMADMEDKYGNKSKDTVAWFQFKKEDLEKIHWDEMTNWKIMEFCYPSVLNRDVKKILLNYCDSSTVRTFAPSFEERVRSGRS